MFIARTFCLLVALAACAFRADATDRAPMRQEIVLLSSVELPRAPNLFYLPEYYATHQDRLEAAFRKVFSGYDYDVRVVRRANASDLSAVLKSARSVAVFWLGHSGGPNGVISDIDGLDVKAVLGDIHPNVRFFGLVGCQGEQILTALREQGKLGGRPDLRTFAFDKKVTDRKALIQAAKASLTTLRSPEIASGYSCTAETRRGFALKIERINGHESLPVTVETRDQLLATFPPGRFNEVQTSYAWIDSPPSKNNWKIILRSGADANAEIDPSWLGSITIEAPGNDVSWSRFQNGDGKAIGGNFHTYLVRGQLPTADDATEHASHSCWPVGPAQPRRSL